MAKVHVITRTGSSGRRYIVRYRLGGREAKLRHGGSFRTMREANERAMFISGEIAGRRAPNLAIEQHERERVTFGILAEQYLETRIDASPSTVKTYRQAFSHLGPIASMEVESIRLAHLQTWITTVATTLAPATVRKYLDAVRQVFDFAEVNPNPARSRRLRLPASDSAEVSPPTGEHVAAIIAALPEKYRLPATVLDWSGLRIGELQALTWGDVDWTANRLRVARGRTKGGTAGRRWVPLPDALMDEIGALKPWEDRSMTGVVFHGLSDQGVRLAMVRACKVAGVPSYSPHDLRHRYISLLVMAGVPMPVIRQVVGHARASVTLDVYSHVLLDEPIEVLQARRDLVERRAGDARVMHGATS